ncbi:MAG TPA: NifB/NifX family molybdenum-iron cluster-binding protein [Nitrospirota bacterium]|jgi:nitrogen fixation protein NifX
MKVAFATTGGVRVDEHFGRAGMFRIYEFTTDASEDLGNRVFAEGRDGAVESTRGNGEAHDAAVEDKVDKLADCGIIYMTAIGGPSAARLTKRGIMPVKVTEGMPIQELVDGLMRTIRTSPPPWLKKQLSQTQNGGNAR